MVSSAGAAVQAREAADEPGAQQHILQPADEPRRLRRRRLQPTAEVQPARLTGAPMLSTAQQLALSGEPTVCQFPASQGACHSF